ncbi:hypothetical protein GGI10_001825 [Coemansia sp. RSA 2530]|nr:hypothetical protein GGI10_001825 [Coemansia sp. RSA 2530]
MIGFSGSQNSQPAQEADTDEAMYEDDEEEEVMATGRLPMCVGPAPINGYASHSQEFSHTLAVREQSERVRPTSSSSTSTDIFLDIIPADHWHGPNWRSMQFLPYIPNEDSPVASSSGSEASEQGQHKRKRPQMRSELLVTPREEVVEVQQPLPAARPASESLQESFEMQVSVQSPELSPPAKRSPQEVPLSPPALMSSPPPQPHPAVIPSQESSLSPPAMQSPPRPSPSLLSTRKPGRPRRSIRMLSVTQSPPLAQPPAHSSTLLPSQELPDQPPCAPPSAQPLDLGDLRELDRSYMGYRNAYVELLIQAWAQGHVQTGNSFVSEEITLMSQLARLSHCELGRSLFYSHSICVQRCTDAPTGGSQAPRWRMVPVNGATSHPRPVSSPRFHLLCQMASTMAQYAAMLPVATAQDTSAVAPEENRPPKRIAATRVMDYSETRLPKHRDNAEEAAYSASNRRQRPGAAHAIKTPRNKSGRFKGAPSATRAGRPGSVGLQTSPRVTAAAESPSNMEPDNDQYAAESVKPSRRGNRTTAEEKRTNKEKRTAAIKACERSQAAGHSIQDHLADQKVVTRSESPYNWPSMAELKAAPFVPIVFRALEDEPSHYIVDCRRSHNAKVLTQTQGFQEFAVDGFPVPVVPDRWLAHQIQKYEQWQSSEPDCVDVRVELSFDDRTCQTSSTLGPPMCRGCITRQVDCSCRFKFIRGFTELNVAMSNNAGLKRYIIAPVFATQVDGELESLVVEPASVSLFVGDYSGSSTTPAAWREFYCLYLTAPTLLLSLGAISATTVERPDATPETSLVYGVHPKYGCSAMPCIYRTISPGFRQSCDVCATSIMSVCFTCCSCGAEMCIGCFSEWDDSDLDQRVLTSHGTIPVANLGPDDPSSWAKRYSHCKKFNGNGDLSLRLQAQHQKQQFIRVSQFTAADIRQVLGKVNSVISLDKVYPELNRISCAGVINDTEAQAFAAKIARIEDRTRRMYSHAKWEMPVMYVEADELSTAEFSCLWRSGVVIVVRGLLKKLDSDIWLPEWWIKHFGDEEVSILDCANGAKAVGGLWPLRNFYRLFDGSDKYADMFDKEAEPSADGRSAREMWEEHREYIRRGIMKIKDWPPTDAFENRLPDHYHDFMNSLPFPEYTQRTGPFNLVNRLPAEVVPPDLGPKMYCAYGSSDTEGGVGTTNLHCDMADAVNIMVYAPPEFLSKNNIDMSDDWAHSGGHSFGASSEASTSASATRAPDTAAAVWDIYPPEAMGDLRKFIGTNVGINYSTDCSGPVTAKHGDPIHNQETYLTLPMRQKFFERFGHKCFRVYQIPGDAVFVPAGCAHQVCNYASAIKIAMDFVSPERVDHSRRLTEEFRRLNNKHPRNKDLLQLNGILWWTFAGEPEPASEPPAESDSDHLEDEQPPQRKSKQQAKSSKRPAKQAKKPAKEAGSGSKARSGSKAVSAKSKGKERASLSSSFSIDEADDSDSHMKS